MNSIQLVEIKVGIVGYYLAVTDFKTSSTYVCNSQLYRCSLND